MSLAANSTVKIRNVGSAEWHDRYAKMDYRLPPGTEGFVPWTAAVLWFGDPFKVDDHKKKHRHIELNRIRVRYGAYPSVKTSDGGSTWDSHVPAIEVYDLDGNRVPMLIDDPKGERVNPAHQTQMQMNMRDATIEQLQQQVQQLTGQIQGLYNQSLAEDQGEMGTDTPPRPPLIPGIPSSPVPPSPSEQSGILHAPTVPTPGVTPGPTSKDPVATEPAPESLSEVPQDTPNRIKVS